MTAEHLEILIESYRLIGVHSEDRDERDIAFKRMGQLIAKRTPDRVAEMERERGLTSSVELVCHER